MGIIHARVVDESAISGVSEARPAARGLVLYRRQRWASALDQDSDRSVQLGRSS